MHAPVARRDDAATGTGRPAVPGGDDAAGPLDDRHQRDDVVRLQARLHHEVDMARRQHAIGVAVGAVAIGAAARLHRVEAASRLRVEQARRGGHDRGRLQPLAGADHEAAAAGRALVAGACAVAPEALADEGLVHHAEDRRAVAGEADQRAPDGDAGDEGLGAVDRIEDPDVLGVDIFVAIFLADDAVAGKGALDELAHRRLAGPVALGDGIEAAEPGLVLDADGGAEEGQDRLSRQAGEVAHEALEIHSAHDQPPRHAGVRPIGTRPPGGNSPGSMRGRGS